MKRPAADTMVESFLAFLDEAITPLHAAATVAGELERAGYDELRLTDRWEIEGRRKLLIRFGDAALIGVRIGDRPLASAGATILVAHTDSPGLRVKERGVSWTKGYLSIPTELYGAPIAATWLDRELGVAGRLALATGTTSLVDLPVRVVIPNLAIHLNRKVNEGFSYNAQDHLVALGDTRGPERPGDSPPGAETQEVSTAHATGGANPIISIAAEAADVALEDVLECELSLYDAQPATLVGSARELLVGPRIDDLSGVFTCLSSFLSEPTDRTALLVLYNHEEVGSLSGEGAQSAALSSTIDRLVRAQGGDAEDSARALARSLLVSNDAAHALHPSYAAKHDPFYAPVLNGGPVLKSNGSMKYATTAHTGAAFARACDAAGVPMQRLVSRSDLRPGSTVGPVSWARTGIPTLDVGIGLLAMHSIRETAGARDLGMMVGALGELLADEGER